MGASGVKLRDGSAEVGRGRFCGALGGSDGLAARQKLVALEREDSSLPEAGSVLPLLPRRATSAIIRHAFPSEAPVLRQGPQLEGRRWLL